MKLKMRDKKDPQDMLTSLDDLVYELSDVGATVPESMPIQYFLEGLPDKYLLENRLLAGEL